MPVSRPRRGVRAVLFSTLLLALATACSVRSARSTDPAAQSAAAELELRPGERVEREVAAGEKHEYRLEIPTGSYVRIVAEPRTMDIALTLLGPDGTTLANADGPGGSRKRELLSLVATTGGSYTLRVERRDAGEARRYSLELQELRPAARGDDLRVTAEWLFAEAFHLQSLSTAEAMKQAIAKYEESLTLWQGLGDGAAQADCLNQAGLVLYAQGEVQEAIARYRRALALARGAEHRRGEGEAENNLGLAYSRLGQPEETLEHYQRALAIWRETGIADEAARTLHNLGVFFNDRGEPRRAVASLEEALPLWRAAGDVAGEANSLNSLGFSYLVYLGETGVALDYLQRALPLSRAAGDVYAEAYITSSLAAAYRTRGGIQQALDLYAQAVAQWERLGEPTSLGNVREALAGLYRDLGELERAAEEYESVLELYRGAGNRDFEARVLTSLGWVESLAGRPLSALPYFARALSISRETGSRPTEATALHRTAIAQLALGQPEEALVNVERALTLHRAMNNRAGEAGALLDLALAQQRLGRGGSAESLEQALELARKAENVALQSSILLRWAQLDHDAGRLDAARARLEEALTFVESVRQQVASRDVRATYFAAKREYYETYIDLLMSLDDTSSGEGFAAEAFEASERARARSLLELLAEGRIDVRQGVAPPLRERERQLAAEITSTQSRLIDLSSKGDADAEKVSALRDQLAAAVRALEELEPVIRARHRRYAEVRYPATSTLPQVQAALGPETALLEYALGRDASYLFVVTREELRAHRLPPAREIAAEVERFRRALASPERRFFVQYLLSARRLYDLLIAPAAAAIEHRVNLIVVADGALHLLSFEALVSTVAEPRQVAAELPFLLRSHAVSYAPSASVLSGLRSEPERSSGGQPRAAKGLVAFAAPARRESAAPAALRASTLGFDASFAALPESRREVHAIARLFPPRDVALFIGEDATEENAKREGVLSGARQIHFATHAFLSSVRPELSGLVLAPAESSVEDGLLQVYEIFNLELHAELVVLSSCESGLGRAVAGEGLVGLARAFLYAGTPSLVVSLWPVNDASTADLMIEFYRRLARGDGPAEALRAAKLGSLERAERSHPFYWAPFVLLGRADAVRSVTS